MMPTVAGKHRRWRHDADRGVAGDARRRRTEEYQEEEARGAAEEVQAATTAAIARGMVGAMMCLLH